MASSIMIGDVGTAFLATIVDEDDAIVDISSATTKQVIFKKPGSSTLTKTAVFFTDGTDGKLVYSSIAGDLDEHGKWRLQGFVVLSSGSWHSSILNFDVNCNLE